MAAAFVMMATASLVHGASNITGIWANEGGDKVTRDELRVTKGLENKTGTVLNRAWNGQRISVFGAANETVSFNLVLEAGGVNPASAVQVAFDTLQGPNGRIIQTNRKATGDGVFNYVGRPIELFYVRYLRIDGLSAFGWFRGSEEQFPARFQAADHSWEHRPDHNKYYPDILVPMELVPTFTIAAGQNQSVWADIYIPKTAVPGTYTGTVSISEQGTVTRTVPVSLTVQPFVLPEVPSIKGFSNLDENEIAKRYISPDYFGWAGAQGALQRQLTDTYYTFFHRHGIDLISGEPEHDRWGVPEINHYYVPRYTGSLFTAANGYDGRGVGIGETIYCIGPYGTWNKIWDEQTMWKWTDGWGSWFRDNLPNTPFFLYLEDEAPSYDFPLLETWSRWISENPGPGHNMLSMATTPMTSLVDMPHLQIPTDGSSIGECPHDHPWSCDNVAYTSSLAAQHLATPGHHVWHYGGGHPGVGTTNTEDDGIAMRTMPWIQAKLGIERWFSWYVNINSPGVDMFQQACTWGCNWQADWTFGQSSDSGYTNGNGVLAYPGSDINHPANSYGVHGPFASLRLKEWRRGTQDGDYLTIAKAINPVATKAILQRTMPQALWEVKDMNWPTGDPSYYYGGISWSSNPDDWESSRAQLAAIISTYCNANPGAGSCLSVPLQATSSTPSAPIASNPVISQPSTPAVPSTPNVTLHFVSMTPCRVVDTRQSKGAFGSPYLAADQKRTFALAAGDCNIPTTARAYMLNVTVVPRSQLTYLTVWPTGTPQPLVSTLNSYDGRIKSNAAVVPAGDNNALDVYAAGDTELILDVNGYFVDAAGDTQGLQFYPVTPCRILDTRNAPDAFGGPYMAGNTQRTIPVLQSACNVPASAQAYAFNYTAIPHSSLDYVSAWPTGAALGGVSSVLNAPTSAVTANAAVTMAGVDGSVTVFAKDETDMIIDLNGYFAAPGTGGMNFYPVLPCRAYDSRNLTSAGFLHDSFALDLTIAGCGVPNTAQAVAVNATVVPFQKLGWISMWPAGQNQPLVSTLNAYDGQVTSNLSFVPTTNGSVSVLVTDPTHLILDVSGYFQ